VDTPPSASPFRWLPWLLAAFAALTALCLAQLYLLNRTENALLREQLALSDANAASLRNQLEAERLLARATLSASPAPESPAAAPASRN